MELDAYVVTEFDAERLDALHYYPTQKEAAQALGIDVRTIERTLAKLRKRRDEATNLPEKMDYPILRDAVLPPDRPEHLWVPDTQVRPGVPTDHINALMNYICERKPDVIIWGGDHWDMPSLNSYEKPGSKYFHEKSLAQDIESGNIAMDIVSDALRDEKVRSGYNPRFVFLEGNHEYRLQRLIQEQPVRFDGLVDRDAFILPPGAEYHNFLEPVVIDGIMYSHYFVNPQSAVRGVLGGAIDNRLNKLKTSFTQGHQQTLLWGAQDLPGGRRIIGLVAGSFYQHDEAYMGPQGNNHWRGVVYKNEVHNGEYDPMMVSLNYLLRKWR